MFFFRLGTNFEIFKCPLSIRRRHRTPLLISFSLTLLCMSKIEPVLFFRASTSSSQTRMSTSDLRGVGISAPTGFVHVSGYNRNFGRCGSVSETSAQQPLVEENDNNSANSVTAMSQPPSRDHSSCRSRMRELSNIDPKFTSQVSNICTT